VLWWGNEALARAYMSENTQNQQQFSALLK